jgi:hypothetical protein
MKGIFVIRKKIVTFFDNLMEDIDTIDSLKPKNIDN